MKIQQIRNATLKITYGDTVFLLDPWLQDKGTGFSAPTVNPEMSGLKGPFDELPMPPEEIIKDVDYCLITHIHPDHFTEEYLPKDINILVQNDIDLKKVEAFGFKNVSVIADTGTKIGNVMIVKTPAVHGDNEQIATMMGKVSGYLLMGEEKSLYIAGDTVFYTGIEETLNRYAPNIILLNCCEATVPKGRLIMNLQDVESVCKLCPTATVIATHMDNVNHALLSSNDVRRFAVSKNLRQIVVPKNGECIER